MTRRPLVAAGAAALTLGLAPSAWAAGFTIQAVDDQTGSYWSPSALDAKVGDTLTFVFYQPGVNTYHNVGLVDPGQDESQARLLGGGSTAEDTTAPEALTQAGTYQFICFVHSGMRGTVKVTAAGDPGGGDTGGTGGGTDTGGGTTTPLPAITPLLNPGFSLGALETGDNVQPRLRSVKVRAIKRGAKLRFTLTKRASVAVSFSRRGKVVKRARFANRRAGTSTVRVRGLKKGAYRVKLVATDRGGLKSTTVARSLKVKR